MAVVYNNYFTIYSDKRIISALEIIDLDLHEIDYNTNLFINAIMVIASN